MKSRQLVADCMLCVLLVMKSVAVEQFVSSLLEAAATYHYELGLGLDTLFQCYRHLIIRIVVKLMENNA